MLKTRKTNIAQLQQTLIGNKARTHGIFFTSIDKSNCQQFRTAFSDNPFFREHYHAATTDAENIILHKKDISIGYGKHFFFGDANKRNEDIHRDRMELLPGDAESLLGQSTDFVNIFLIEGAVLTNMWQKEDEVRRYRANFEPEKTQGKSSLYLQIPGLNKDKGRRHGIVWEILFEGDSKLNYEIFNAIKTLEETISFFAMAFPGFKECCGTTIEEHKNNIKTYLNWRYGSCNESMVRTYLKLSAKSYFKEWTKLGELARKIYENLSEACKIIRINPQAMLEKPHILQ